MSVLIKDTTKPNLLIVSEYNRTDFVDIFKDSINNFNFFFIEYASRKEVKNQYYKKYGQAIFWGDFEDAQDLLHTINPDKVVFFFIETYHQVLLNLTCKVKGICTYHIDHGIRDAEVNIRLEEYLMLQKKTTTLFSSFLKLFQFKARIKARLFLLNTIKMLPDQEAGFIKQYIKIRKNNSWIDTLKQVQSPFILPSAYISFSFKTFEVHQYYNHLDRETKFYFIGIPIFDHLSSLDPDVLEKNILFIDQGLAERGIFGWTQAKYDQFIKQLVTIAAKYRFNLHLKPHPRQIPPSHNNIRLVNDEDMLHLIPKTPIVLGFASTYLLPLIAQQHTTVITLENHPIGKLNVSKSFIDAGVAHPVYDLEELHTLLPNIDELHQKQLPNKAKFTEEWMYKFDGKAGERLRDILLSDEV